MSLPVDNMTVQITNDLSTQFIVKAGYGSEDYIPIGAIKSLNITQSRSITYYDGIPAPFADITIDIERFVIDAQALKNVDIFGMPFRSVMQQKKPFNIEIHCLVKKLLENECTSIVTCYNCWFKSISTQIKADNYIIIEKSAIVCEKLTTIETEVLD